MFGAKMSLKNKVALITGSGSGIGAATAVLFANEGADVIIVDKNEAGAKEVSNKIEKNGKKPLVIITDITNDEKTKDVIIKSIEKFGKLDILINNAGILKAGNVLDGSLMKVYDQVMNVNLRALVLMTTVASPFLVKSKGCIVNVASISAFSVNSSIGCAAYSISKAGVKSFTESTALELAASGVRVNAIAPGPVATNITADCGLDMKIEDCLPRVALGKLSQPEEMADLILFLASDKGKSITGSCFVADNGMMLM